MISEDQEVIDARQELENWKKMVEAAETEKSRLLLEKLDAEETKKNAQKETVALLTQQQKTADEALKRKHELEDEIKDLEKRNKALSERLKEYEERLSAKRATYATLQQKTKIKADIPDKKVKFVGVMKEEERDISSEDIQSHFTVICRPSFRLKGGQALLTFEEQTVAEKILRMTKCPVMFDNTKMDVKPYCVDLEPSVKFEVHFSVSKKKIRFSSAPPVLSDERMRDRIELSFSRPSLGGGEVNEVDYNSDTGTGHITFLNTGVAENLGFSKKYSVDAGRKIDVGVSPFFEYQLKNFQTFSGTSKRTILLEGIDDILEEEDLQDHLEIHFQKPSNGGGEVESIKYISKGRALTAYFSEDSPETES